MVDTTCLNKADVLAALYNASRPQGMGFIQYKPEPMTREQAQMILETQVDFDYLQGRVMKINLRSDEGFNESLYDRDNGDGAALAAIEALRTGGVNAQEIQIAHSSGRTQAAIEMLANSP